MGLLDEVVAKIKTVIGDSAYDTRQFYAAAIDRQEVAARLACNMLNRMAELGRPKSRPIED